MLTNTILQVTLSVFLVEAAAVPLPSPRPNLITKLEAEMYTAIPNRSDYVHIPVTAKKRSAQVDVTLGIGSFRSVGGQ